IAKTGESAIALIPTQPPALVVINISTTPKMDALRLIKQIRQHPNCTRVPIIALTASATEGNQKQCLAAGASDSLTQP
ncbi:response regulator, partial [Tritonibacter sp. SIMBA_163]|uniref:response regulator n=1 Tax=Tritonibacter sp. SIMBA_163 TaxID=3080868 RepID=UPI0039803D53